MENGLFLFAYWFIGFASTLWFRKKYGISIMDVICATIFGWLWPGLFAILFVAMALTKDSWLTKSRW